MASRAVQVCRTEQGPNWEFRPTTTYINRSRKRHHDRIDRNNNSGLQSIANIWYFTRSYSTKNACLVTHLLQGYILYLANGSAAKWWNFETSNFVVSNSRDFLNRTSFSKSGFELLLLTTTKKKKYLQVPISIDSPRWQYFLAEGKTCINTEPTVWWSSHILVFAVLASASHLSPPGVSCVLAQRFEICPRRTWRDLYFRTFQAYWPPFF